MSSSAFLHDAFTLPAARIDIVPALLSAQFNDPDAQKNFDEINIEAIGAAHTEPASTRTLIAKTLEIAK